MFVVYVITLVCLVSLSHSAPLACEDSVRPLDVLDLHHLEGRWALVAGSLSDTELEERFKQRDSVIINFSNANKTSKTSFTRIFGFGERCQYMYANITLEGSSFTFDEFNLTVTILHTSCPDCVVMRFDYEATQPLRVYLFSRRREVEQQEMEAFRAQVKCLNMPAPVTMDPTKKACPDHPPTTADTKTEG